VWDASSRALVARSTLNAAARCCHFDRTCSFLAVGTQAGAVHVFTILSGTRDDGLQRGGKGEAMSSQARAAGEGRALAGQQFFLQELCFRRDFREGVNDVKFSPLDDKVAAGRYVFCLASLPPLFSLNLPFSPHRRSPLSLSPSLSLSLSLLLESPVPTTQFASTRAPLVPLPLPRDPRSRPLSRPSTASAATPHTLRTSIGPQTASCCAQRAALMSCCFGTLPREEFTPSRPRTASGELKPPLWGSASWAFGPPTPTALTSTL
jgi:hypothetical protein